MSSNIGIDGARALAEELKINTRTSWIWLYNNGVLAEGAEAIALALKDHDQALRTISLYGNDIRVRGAKAFGTMLQHNHKMKELFLGANSIGDEGVHALADGRYDFSLRLIAHHPPIRVHQGFHCRRCNAASFSQSSHVGQH